MRQGRELLRRLHQDHLDLRAAREQRREKVTGSDDIIRTRVKGRATGGAWRPCSGK
jgi:hypothetical protein